MTVLQVADVGFGYGARRLFQGITFSLEQGQRAALVAPNGAGKSTLMRLIGREMPPDEGQVVVRKGVRVAFFRQSHELTSDGTVMDAFLAGFTEVLDLRHALTDAQHAAASGSDEALARLSDLTDRYHLSGGDDLERRVEMIAGHLGFHAKDMDRPVTSLSGGERGRLQLGVVLALEPDLLLLDEPTNHLDIETIAWLERHLVGMTSAMLIVSHDRAFMDAVCPHTMELGTKSFRTYPLKYSDYAVAREEDLARERELVERQQDMISKTEDFIRRNIAGQKTKQAQSRRKMLDKLDVLDRPEDVWALAEKVAFRFAPAPRTGDIVLDVHDVAASRGGRVLFSDVELLLRRGDRLGIVGPNGSGKTTLLKILAGQGAPEDQGEVKRGTNLNEGYFDQHLGSLDPSKTAVEEIRSVRPDMNVDVARQYLARFRFYGDDALRRVNGFSGGERSRLALGKLLLEPRNLLFLDEPTNHLDIPAAEILEEALVGFEGTVVLISHDRRFLEKVTTRILSVHEAHVDVYPGGFKDWRDALDRRAAAEAEAERDERDERDASRRGPESRGARAVRRSSSTRPTAPAASSASSASTASTAAASPAASDDPIARKRAFEADKAAARALERKRKRVKELETQIASGEAELETLREALKQDPGGDWAKLARKATEEQALTKRVDAAMTEWMTLSEELASLGGAG
ncbi:ABC-F family ATP-binding cassette domain-containing protein [Chondromyces apiculatus]|uniref:ABC transporter ATP-binding protein n=1 Tax=Chondromyces apiculatus DSM 436 TaxID=1192034 RepID=A0A017STA4_9BACT|nr:ABC-F family ATP-binding cassette domain-containing protein [Chondromyces apiculatus]EYE99996.1 ABC transporter ATP-binding protein [Chondromyces apiculatus DSM 436]